MDMINRKSKLLLFKKVNYSFRSKKGPLLHSIIV